MKILCILACAIAALSVSRTAAAQSTPYLAQVDTFAFNFCPSGWLPADGRLLPIGQNNALFALLGTTYGGDGVTTFALPLAKPVYTLLPNTTLLSCIAVLGVFPSRP